ncbi:MAG: hypothetical protein RJB39_639 [Candidatus Parcubacteria bacterium]|jgi:hypothetical protein
MNLTFKKLKNVDEATTARINALMRKLHGLAAVHTVTDLADIMAKNDIYVAEDSTGEILAAGLFHYQRLLTHPVARIHNLSAGGEDPEDLLNQMITAMVRDCQRDYPRTEIQINIHRKRETREALVRSLGFVVEDKQCFKLKVPKKKK